MEIHHQQRTNSNAATMGRSKVGRATIGRYVVYLIMAAIAAGISIYFYAPKPVDKAANKNMSLFLQNKISDIDLKLKNGDSDTDLATRLSWHKSNAVLYDEAKGYTDEKIGEQAEIMKKKMVQVQRRDFPELRTAYVDSKKEALDEQHVTIGVTGDHQEVLTFEGKMFKPKQVQDDFMKNIYGIVNDLRFKKVVYKWSETPEGQHHYEIKSKGDTEI